MVLKHDHFSLANFEGPLDFLVYLIRKEEVHICDVPIQQLIQQFLDLLHSDRELEKGAEFVETAAYLVWLKSRTLLPSTEQLAQTEEVVEDPHFEIIHHLIDYCRFKQAAKELASRHEKQQACYFRGLQVPESKKPLGIDHVSLNELSHLFKDMMSRAAQAPSLIQEENWRVSDKIRLIRSWLSKQPHFALQALFSPNQPRAEIIVTFLAILELMKIGELAIDCSSSSPRDLKVVKKMPTPSASSLSHAKEKMG